MFDSYFAKFQKLGKDTPRIFERTAKKGAQFFVDNAKNLTDEENLVDTGNYKRNWYADAVNIDNKYIIYAENSVNYASYLEDGHSLKGGGRWKGRKIGERSLDATLEHCMVELDKALDRIIKRK